ncbi:flagellar basal body protein FliL [Prauserella muralis]|uniref:Uncharacterized protein n=1 Tax=Prauserella muralis TaxID=588067 RepID=A0A2V4B962_9PSEU|nr:flagellar basal body protein FliL [Prauserella muralis]PXY31780.1 hypothetical protein BAY60_05395 [Prauserella muralis]TWE13823.1 hypothetical protein FHX69_5952 [Prauserella muralis]
MSWQEELRKLDEELASGRLSADDYRVRRDQVLSSAVAHGDDSAAGTPQSPQTPQQPDQQQPSQPQNQQDQQGGGQNADSTQVIPPVTPPADSGAERTQAVPPWQAQQPQQHPQAQPPHTGYPQQHPAGPVSPAGGFQQPASPAGGFQQPGAPSPAGGFQQPHQPPQQMPWNAPDPDQSPPWGGSDFPPIAPTGSSEWAAQGPEGFDDKPGGGKGKLFAGIGAVVLLAAIAVGAFLIWGTGGDDNGGGDNQAGGQPPASSAAPSSSQPPPDPLPLNDLPGNEEAHPEVKTFDDVPDLNYLNDQELESYQRTEPGDAKFAVYRMDNGNVAALLLTQVGDAGAASDEVSNLTYIQTTNGAQRVLDGVPDNVRLTAFTDPKNKQKVQLRGHYLAGDVLVRIEVNSESGLDSARSDFDKILDAQLEVLPAGA